MKSYIRAVASVFRKELLSEFRSKELLSVMLVFALLVIFIFNYALDMQNISKINVVSGVLWVTYTFAGTLGMNRSLAIENENNCLDGLLLLPVDRTVIYFGKMLANFVFMLFLALILVPLYSIFFNIQLWNPGLFLVIVLGIFGFVSVGTLIATLTIKARTREMLLPVLLLPVILPLVVAAVKATSGFLFSEEQADIQMWLNLIVAYDLIFTAIAVMVYDFILEE